MKKDIGSLIVELSKIESRIREEYESYSNDPLQRNDYHYFRGQSYAFKLVLDKLNSIYKQKQE